MHKIFLGLMLVGCTFLLAESFSLETDMGGMTVTVNEKSSGSSNFNIVDEIAVRLEKLEKKYNVKLNKLDQKKSAKIVNEIYELLAMMPEDISITANSTISSSNEQVQRTDVNITFDVNDHQKESEADLVKHKTLTIEEIDSPKAMSESEFNQLMANVDNESFADDQTSVVRIAAKSKYFTINQLTRLLTNFTFADDKINIVQIVYPRIVDNDNSHNLLKAFTFSSDKQKVEQIINQ